MGYGEKELTFWEHFEELIKSLQRAFYALLISVLFVMFFPVSLVNRGGSIYNPWYNTLATLTIERLKEDFLPEGVELIPISWFAPLQVYLYVSLILGAFLSSPIIAYELYKFITPALYEHERKSLMFFVAFFTLLFISGFLLGYLLVVPATVKLLLLSTMIFGLSPLYEFSQFYSLVAGGLFICGFVMTGPLYLIMLVKAGVIDAEKIKNNRKYLYGALMIAISILDPDPTLVTELFLGIPLIAVLEITIMIVSRFEGKKEIQ